MRLHHVGFLVAAAAAIGSSSANAERAVDEAELEVRLLSSGGDIPGYRFRVMAYVSGARSNDDAVRIDWIQGGKKVAQQRCPFVNGDSINCEYAGGQLTASGDITATLTFLDDKDGKEYLLRTLNLKVGVFTWIKRKSYQIVGDDLLGSAIAWHGPNDDPRGKNWMHLYFWAARTAEVKSSKLRCAVDGKALTEDIPLGLHEQNSLDAQDDSTGKEVRYRWVRYDAYSGLLVHGTEASAGQVALGQYPGTWTCDLRSEGAVIRSFKFVVDRAGKIQPPAWQAAQKGATLYSTEVFVDMSFPRTPWDERFRPDAIRASHRFGLAWPADPAVKAAHAALPPANGLPDWRR